MKKHLVIIVGNFYPKPSPTGKCAEAYADLLKDEFDISVICLADTDCLPYTYNGKQVYPAAGWYTLFQHRLERKGAPRLLQNMAKVPVHMLRKFTQPNLLYSYVSAAEKQLEKCHRERPVDVIFSVGAPMAAHTAAERFRRKHPHVRWITYTVDSYCAQNGGDRKSLRYEGAVLRKSDWVLLSEELYKNSTKLYEDFKTKCVVLPYLMPPTPQKVGERQYFDSNKINLVYAGRFYKDIRNPEYLLRLAMEMDENCVLHLYCQSDCDDLINKWVCRANGKILRHPPVSVEEIQQIYTQADVLVNVGNNTAEFKPSKTFEYIASGKPILNIFYPGLRDEMLDKNALVLQLQKDMNLQEASEQLRWFIQTNYGKILPWDEIEKQYYKHSRENISRILRAATHTK